MEIYKKGSLATVSFMEVFASIATSGKSGVLSIGDVETKKTKKRIGFKNGNQVYVSGGTVEETLGRMLLTWKKITERQYHDSLAYQKKNNKKTGEALIEMKIYDGSQLAEALQKQTEEKIQNCFSLTEGLFSFIEANPPDDNSLIFFKINPEKIVFEGIKRLVQGERLEKLFQPLYSTKFSRTARYNEILQKIGFAPAELRIAQALKNGVGIPEILTVAGSNPTATLQIVFSLYTVGAIESQHAGGAQHAAPPVAQPRPAPSPRPAARPDPPPVEQAPVEEPAQTLETEQPQEQFGVEGEDAEGASSPENFGVEGEDDAEVESESRFGVEGEDDAAMAGEPQHSVPKARKPAPPKAPKRPSVVAEEKKKEEEIVAEIGKFEKILKESTFFELLGVSREDSPALVKKAFFRLAKKFHPDTNPAFFKGDFKNRAEEVFTRIGEAYNTLIDKKAREEYIYTLDHHITQEDMERANRALEAESTFMKAEILFKRGDFRGAQVMLDEALRLNPDEPEYLLYQGWCIYKNTQGAAIEDARRTLMKALEGLHDKKDLANYYLGMLAKIQKKPLDEQRRFFAAAVEANPNNTPAASELRYIDSHGGKTPDPKKDDARKKGLFGVFKK